MNKNITLGIIFIIILVVGIWNPNLLEGVTSKQPSKLTIPHDTLSAIKKNISTLKTAFDSSAEEVTQAIKINGLYRPLHGLKNSIIAYLEKEMLGKFAALGDDFNHSMESLYDEQFIQKVTLYNGLRAMPY